MDNNELRKEEFKSLILNSITKIDEIDKGTEGNLHNTAPKWWEDMMELELYLIKLKNKYNI